MKERGRAQRRALIQTCGLCVQYRLSGCTRDLTVDVRLLVQLGDAQQVRPLLLAADPSLAPRQRGLEVELVTAVRQRVGVPEGRAATA